MLTSVSESDAVASQAILPVPPVLDTRWSTLTDSPVGRGRENRRCHPPLPLVNSVCEALPHECGRQRHRG